MKLVDPAGADAIVVTGGVLAAVAAVVAVVRWLAARGSELVAPASPAGD